jgi:3-methylfumaryl-CoA hydratase
MDEVLERTELLGPEPATALAGLLDVPLPDLEAGEGLPLTWHWVYLLERPPQRDLGPDGHAARNAVPEPPGPGRRRMWAGGALLSLGPLRVGERATRRSRVLNSTEKVGRTGRLTFVSVGHTISQRGEVVLEERQDILYRDADAAPVSPVSSSASSPSSAEPEADARVQVAPAEWAVPIDPVVLFRFSALTYNAHRIHYDRDYAQQEGYPGLVVHGPLQAVAMAEAARSSGLRVPAGGRFEYRLVAPLLDHQGLVVGAIDAPGEGVRTTVRDHWGRRTAEGRLF